MVEGTEALRSVIARFDALAVAISGGVDSTTLAAVAHQVLGDDVLMVHAISPAVPPEATARVRDNADRLGWNLEVVDAGEFADRNYTSNPINRCYYCKSNLYARVQTVWSGVVASGANLDDLGDYRPGLLAASERQVVHPLIEAGIDKSMVRAIARRLDLDTVADLPAQPCLSSRIETGIAINVDDLIFVHKVESLLVRRLGAGDIRCRITGDGVRIEVEDKLRLQQPEMWQSARHEVAELVAKSKRVLVKCSGYERGSAFVHDSHPACTVT